MVSLIHFQKVHPFSGSSLLSQSTVAWIIPWVYFWLMFKNLFLMFCDVYFKEKLKYLYFHYHPYFIHPFFKRAFFCVQCWVSIDNNRLIARLITLILSQKISIMAHLHTIPDLPSAISKIKLICKIMWDRCTKVARVPHCAEVRHWIHYREFVSLNLVYSAWETSTKCFNSRSVKGFPCHFFLYMPPCLHSIAMNLLVSIFFISRKCHIIALCAVGYTQVRK